jgi:hypothetical protein
VPTLVGPLDRASLHHLQRFTCNLELDRANGLLLLYFRWGETMSLCNCASNGPLELIVTLLVACINIKIVKRKLRQNTGIMLRS